tara:strand:+ start:173 stop:367 length:195 start_codon:yes stop_codon:yes gene_type:complete
MRELTKKQKTLLSKWYKEQSSLISFEFDDLSIEQLEVLEEINDTEILYQNINRFLNDLWAKENE